MINHKYYIASGFFNESQLSRVVNLESKFDAEGVSYFSPRSVTADLSPSNPDREKNAKMLFDLDLKKIHESETIWVMLDDSMDIGTLFELGYAAAQITMGNASNEFLKLDIDGKYKLVVEYFVKRLLECNIEERPYSEVTEFMMVNEQEDYLKVIRDLYNMNFSLVDSDDITRFEHHINQGKIPVFMTDDRPWKLFILMGFVHGLGIKFYTSSIRNYGSNIMIASSSAGHINLPVIMRPCSVNETLE